MEEFLHSFLTTIKEVNFWVIYIGVISTFLQLNCVAIHLFRSHYQGKTIPKIFQDSFFLAKSKEGLLYLIKFYFAIGLVLPLCVIALIVFLR